MMNRRKVDRLKDILAAKYARRRIEMEEREERHKDLEKRMNLLNMNEEEREKCRIALQKYEQSLRRANMKRHSIEDFISLKIIGRGAYGEVRLVRHRDTAEIWALKSMEKTVMRNKNQVHYVQSERDVLASSDSEWIVKLQYSFQDDLRLYMVMEFLPGGDLMGLLIREDIFTEEGTRHYIAEIIEALSCIHSIGYIHRDLKPDNILIDKYGHLKLSDLGLTKKLKFNPTYLEGIQNYNAILDEASEGEAPHSSDESIQEQTEAYQKARKQTRELAYSSVGTPDYIAPEVIRKNGYGAECDWWSLGVIMFECLIGYPPFHGRDTISTCKKINQWKQYLKIPRKFKSILSYECIDFMLSLICEPTVRLGKNSINEIRSHPWLLEISWETLRNDPAPHVPENAGKIDNLINHIKKLDISDPKLLAAVNELVGNFDEIEEVEGNEWGQNKRVRRDKIYGDFIGYTYVRKPVMDSENNFDNLTDIFTDDLTTEHSSK